MQDKTEKESKPTDGRGGRAGEDPNHTTTGKPGSLCINQSILPELPYLGNIPTFGGWRRGVSIITIL
jgi:hypothetical protein